MLQFCWALQSQQGNAARNRPPATPGHAQPLGMQSCQVSITMMKSKAMNDDTYKHSPHGDQSLKNNKKPLHSMRTILARAAGTGAGKRPPAQAPKTAN